MSLHRPPLPPSVPEETARVARAAFPKGNPYLTLRDDLGPIFADRDFADLHPERGRPACPPWRLALVTLLQFREGLSDRQAAEAVRARIDWKYLLDLELGDAGFDFSLLCDFRSRLLAGSAEERLLERVLEAYRAHGLLKARGRQRTDSTHVLAAVRKLNRLELLGETLRAALNAIATAEPDWLRALAPPAWYERYGRRIEDFRLPKTAAAREAYASQVGDDGFQLLAALDAPGHRRRWRPCRRSRRCGRSGDVTSSRRVAPTPRRVRAGRGSRRSAGAAARTAWNRPTTLRPAIAARTPRSGPATWCT